MPNLISSVNFSEYYTPDITRYYDFIEYKITNETIKYHFGNISILHEYMKENYEEYLAAYLYSIEKLFDESRDVSNSKKKRFVITTAVDGAKAHIKFLSALDNYAEKNNAQIVIMPCESVTNSFENNNAVFDKEFIDKKYMFVQKNTPLNDNLFLCSIQVSAKQIKPITGLERLGNREGSYIFASPKQFLEYVPSGNSRSKNYSIMTTGACTLPKYYDNKFVSKRLSYIADHDHTIGAIIVEIENDKLFHFRQIQAAEDGSFIDYGIQYNEDGTTENVVTNVIFGDLHGVSIEHQALNVFLNDFSKLEVQSIFIHDLFDGYSISHHIDTIGEMSYRSDIGRDDLSVELIETKNLLLKIDLKLDPKNIYVVKSNHDEFLYRYLKEGRYIKDPKNHYLALDLARKMLENIDPLEYVLKSGLKDNVIFLSREDTVRIAGVECAAHGDLGTNGAKASMNTFEKIYGNCVVGHSHSPAIQRGVFRVGTLSKLDMGYNRGPSSWAHTSCLLYENGQRQLINIVNGKTKL